jgi:tRNA G18 (ribose-2'-O)-methylase SpoU
MRGYAAIGIERPKTADNVGTLWRSAHLFGASYVFTIGSRTTVQVTDTMKATRHMPLLYYRDTADWLEHAPDGAVIVGVELTDDAVPLPEFKHPQRAVYVLGAEDDGLSSEVLALCKHVVQIPTPQSLNVATAGSIVLYDRLAKAQER